MLSQKKISYPILRIDDRLTGNSWFSFLDLKSYWQVKIRPKDKEKTAFSIGKGLAVHRLSVSVMLLLLLSD